MIGAKPRARYLGGAPAPAHAPHPSAPPIRPNGQLRSPARPPMPRSRAQITAALRLFTPIFA